MDIVVTHLEIFCKGTGIWFVPIGHFDMLCRSAKAVLGDDVGSDGLIGEAGGEDSFLLLVLLHSIKYGLQGRLDDGFEPSDALLRKEGVESSATPTVKIMRNGAKRGSRHYCGQFL